MKKLLASLLVVICVLGCASVAYADEGYDYKTTNGFTMKTVRPFGVIPRVENLPTTSELLTTEYIITDAIAHRHTPVQELAKGAYFYDTKRDDCWIEEELQVQLYPKEGHNKGWVYDEGEDLSDWLTSVGNGLIIDGGSTLVTKDYEFNGLKWKAWYVSYETTKPAKDNFNPLQCFAFAKLPDGDFVSIKLQHAHTPTALSNEYCPTYEIRMKTAQESLEMILSTIKRETTK